MGSSKRDGYVDNVITGGDINDKDRYTIRGQLLIQLSDSLSARLIADYSEIDEVCCAGANVFDGPADTTALYNAAIAAGISPD